MDANELINGVSELYGNILPKAYSSSEWNEDSITTAFHWADFCEQIYKNYKDNTCKRKIDELIHSLALNFNDVNQEICFEDLKKSTDILCEAFSENPTVENHLIESVLLKIRSDKSSFEAAKEEHELDSLCVELLEALKPIKILNSEKSFYSEVQAILYLDALKTSVLHMTSEEEVEKYLSNCLEKLCESTYKMVQLLHVLMVKLSDDEISSTRDIQEFAINWTMYKILSDKNCPLAQFMWKQPSQLRSMSQNSSNFLSFYLDFLTECASSLTPELGDSEIRWIPRSSDFGVLSYNELLNHFRCLLGADDDVCELTKQNLMNLLNSQPEMEIWKEIFSRVT